MLCTTLEVVPGESTFELNMFAVMCGVLRFWTFFVERRLGLWDERWGENIPSSMHESEYPVVLKAHNSHIKPISIDNRHVRLSLLSQQCCWWFFFFDDDAERVKSWWKHERIFFLREGFWQFIVARRSLGNFVALVIHFIIHSAKLSHSRVPPLT